MVLFYEYGVNNTEVFEIDGEAHDSAPPHLFLICVPDLRNLSRDDVWSALAVAPYP
jgi:hypothetical protein